MNYKAICQSNQALYAELESLTREITCCVTNNLVQAQNILLERKEAVQSLINTNLEMLADIWKTEKSRAYKGNRREIYKNMPRKERAVVLTYIQNPNLTMDNIGKQHGLCHTQANRIITEYLTKKYNAA